MRGIDDIEGYVNWGEEDGQKKRSKNHVNLMKLEVKESKNELATTIDQNEAHIRLMFGTWLTTRSRGLIAIGIVICIAGLGLEKFTTEIKGSSISMVTNSVLKESGSALMRSGVKLVESGSEQIKNSITPENIKEVSIENVENSLKLLETGSEKVETGLRLIENNKISPIPFLWILILVNILLLLGIWWVKYRIEKLFHYRRVRELTDIVMCYSIMKSKKAEPNEAS